MYDQQYNNQGMAFNQNQNYQPGFQKNPPKKRGLKIFNVHIFDQFNPKYAILYLEINPFSGDLYMGIAPAFPNNAAIGSKGPVSSGTKVYNYEKKVVTKFAYHEIVKVKNFFEGKLEPNITAYTQLANLNKQYLEQLIQNQNTAQMIPMFQQLLDFNAKTLTSIDTNNSLALFRKPQDGRTSSDDKTWNFNYDEEKKLFYVSVSTNNKENRISLGFSREYGSYLYEIIKSYVTGYTTLQTLGSFVNSLSDALVSIGAPIDYLASSFILNSIQPTDQNYNNIQSKYGTAFNDTVDRLK